jgi:hypothetical protein
MLCSSPSTRRNVVILEPMPLLTNTTVNFVQYIEYYTAAGELLKKYKDSTVEIIRNFGKVMTLKGLTDKFSNWVNKHSRPLVLEFDDRTIKDIFQKQKDAIVLFN